MKSKCKSSALLCRTKCLLDFVRCPFYVILYRLFKHIPRKLTGATDAIKLNLTGTIIQGRAVAHTSSSEPQCLIVLYNHNTTRLCWNLNCILQTYSNSNPANAFTISSCSWSACQRATSSSITSLCVSLASLLHFATFIGISLCFLCSW